MYPQELRFLSNKQTLAKEDKYSAVLFTGSSLRHRRFGYLLQEQFPELIKVWYASVPKKLSKKEKLNKALSRALPGSTGNKKRSSSDLIHKALKKGLKNNIKHVTEAVHSQLKRLQYPTEEKRMFEWEVEMLSQNAHIQPTNIDNTNSEEISTKIKKISPYLLLTFGGPLLRQNILDSVRGYAINQHAGHSPELKGANTTEMAIYQRRIDKIGSTVHLMDIYADAGPILRRSLATIHPDDTTGNCFLAVTALGNHLMVETIDNILNSDEFYSYEQEPGTGTTILNSDLTLYRKKMITQDISAMLEAELKSIRDF